MTNVAVIPFAWWPERASQVAAHVDILFLALTLASGLLVAALAALNLGFLVRYRQGSNAPRLPLSLAAWKIEVAWITATTLVFLGFFGWGAVLFVEMQRPPAGAYDIRVVARQWMWDVRHPNGRREFNQLHVPTGRPVRLLLASEDVIHSFFVPAFRVKQDVVPGKQVSAWFEATREGTYHWFCAEFCGTKHSAMTGSVVAVTPAAYAEWLDAGDPGGETIARGRRLFTQHGCSGCHSPSSAVHAPALEGLYGRRVPLADGTFVAADDRYLRDSILQPQRELTAGYEKIMPSFEGIVSPNDLLDLVAYLKSLRAPAPSATPPPPPPPPVPRTP